MAVSQHTAMALKSYQNQAHVLVKSYLLAAPFIPYTSILGGILACKVAYDLTQLISSSYIKTYAGLTKMQKIDWNNRGVSTIHAIFVTALSLYLVFWSGLFSDQRFAGLFTFRSSALSTFGLGVVHHSISEIAVTYSMFTREAQIYTYMILISEVTTPEINMRWYLDKAGMKKSRAYLINSILIFFAWLVARVLLFIYMFYHVYRHCDQVIQMSTFGYTLVFVVPLILAILNLVWFEKIIKGLRKTLAERQ